MRSSNPLTFCKVLAFVLLFCASGVAPASAQTGAAAGQQRPQPPAAANTNQRTPPPAAHMSDVACGGFIEQQSPAGQPQIVGGEQERERTLGGQRPMRIVAVTGWAEGTDRAKSREAGFDLHLVKPLDMNDLARALKRNAAVEG